MALKIAYIGGGSKFVVTLLHGLAEYREQLVATAQAIDLVLFDVEPGRCSDNVRYADITAAESGLRLSVMVAETLVAAITGCDWLIFSPGLHAETEQQCRRMGVKAKSHFLDAGPDLVVESLAVWPAVAAAAGLAVRHAPRCLFSILENPTDVLASAVQRRFGLTTAGICVEVSGLSGFLSYYLGLSRDALDIEYFGVNHYGWVTRWRAAGRDGGELFAAEYRALAARDDWWPGCDWLITAYAASGYLRNSPYHCWPLKGATSERHQERRDTWMRTCLPGWSSKVEYRAAVLAKALDERRMIGAFDPRDIHPEATPYWWPDARWTLGAIAVGCAGGSAGPVPLQTRNGDANPVCPPDAFLEVPTGVESGVLRPQNVTIPEAWMLHECIGQRRLVAAWLAGERDQSLSAALMETVELFDLDEMAAVLSHASQPDQEF